MPSAITQWLSPRRARSLARHFTAVICCLLLVNSLTFAQGARGTIRGEVTDSAGANVVGASIKLVNTATQQEVRTVQTNSDGVYQFLEIDPADYNVVITATGFADATLEAVKVEPNRNVQLDVALNVAGSTNTVEVTAGDTLVDKESGTLGTTVDRRRVQGLPLNGRNVLQLAQLQPGVQSTAAGDGTDTLFGGSGFRINGNRATETNVTLDGSNNNEPNRGQIATIAPRPDAVEEFRLLTSNYEAEFGRNTGGVVNIVTRSGSSEYHGNARIFYRPTFLSAAGFFAKANVTQEQREAGADGDELKRRFERKEFGGNLGGPIKIPYLYDGKDRTFFFVDYEGRRQNIGQQNTLTGLPTAAERAGDFSAATTAVRDPATGQPFPGGQIPTSRFSPIALYYLQFIPVPGDSGQVTVIGNQITKTDQVTARVDHRITDNQTVNYTFNYGDSVVVQPFAFGWGVVPGFGALDKRTSQNSVVRHTYTFTPTLINSFLASYARNNQPGVFPDNATTPAEIGFTANFVAASEFAGPPAIRLLNHSSLQFGNTIQGPQSRITENFQVQDSVAWATGDHRFKFGVDATWYRQQTNFLFVNQGIFTFCGTCGGNTTRNDFADFLIGNTPAAVQFGANGDRDPRQKAVALFAQDTWRVRDDLTLSLGIRYEYTSPFTDLRNRVAYFRPGAVSELLLSGQIIDPDKGVPVTIRPGSHAPLGLVYPGDPDPVLGGVVPDGGVKRDFNNFAPRVGFAYSPRMENEGIFKTLLGENATVVRGGVGMYYGAVIGDTQLQQLSAPAYNGTNAFFSPASGTFADPFAPDPFPNYGGNQGQLANPFAQGTTLGSPLTQFSRQIDPNILTPYVFQWNLTVERAFATDYVATVSYVGSKGTKLYVIQALNAPRGTFFPGFENVPVTTSNGNARRPYEDFDIGISQTATNGNSWYNALQTNLQKRYSNGLLFQTAYTWSRSIDDASDFRDTIDLVDRRFDRGLSDFDVEHRFVGSFIYDLPFWDNTTGVLNRLADGWSIGGIYTAEGGKPFSIGNSFNTTFTDGITTFADLGAPLVFTDPRQTDGRLFNADAFRAFSCQDGAGNSICFRRGTQGRNQFRAPDGINNFDFIVTKKTQLWSESSNLELRFEFFNAFNHTQFDLWDGTLTSSTFGKFTSARESRVVQLAARVNF